MNILIFIFIVYNILTIGAFRDVKNLQCRGTSTCIILPNCKPFMHLLDQLEKPLRPSVVTFLRAQECGFQNGYPKVCCSNLPKNLKILRDLKQCNHKNCRRKSLKEKETTTMKIPKAFLLDYMEFMDSMDFFIRRRNSEPIKIVDIEIR